MKSQIKIPSSAEDVHSQIVSILQALLNSKITSPLHPDFLAEYRKLFLLFDKYQKEIILASVYSIFCKKGCAYCCNHWVEDIYSFEAEIIAEYIKNNFSKYIANIIKTFRQDEETLKGLNEIVRNKLLEQDDTPETSKIDSVDLLLGSFYQLERPCALLTKEGTCRIYEVRPLTCRVYFNFFDPGLCAPDKINDSDTPTCLLDLKEEASTLLDALHEKYKRFDKTGLRAVLIDYLTE